MNVLWWALAAAVQHLQVFNKDKSKCLSPISGACIPNVIAFFSSNNSAALDFAQSQKDYCCYCYIFTHIKT